MTGRQLSKLLDRLGITHTEAALLIGVGYRQITRYLSDVAPLPESSRKLFKLLDIHVVTLDQVRKL